MQFGVSFSALFPPPCINKAVALKRNGLLFGPDIFFSFVGDSGIP